MTWNRVRIGLAVGLPIAVGVTLALLSPQAVVAVPTFQAPSANDQDTDVATFILFVDSAGASSTSDTGEIRRNGTAETQLSAIGADLRWDSSVTPTQGRNTFEVIYESNGVRFLGDSATRTIWRADSPTTISVSSPVALSGVSQVKGTTSRTIASGETVSITFSGTVFDIGVDTPANVKITCSDSRGIAFPGVNDSALTVTAGSWSGAVVVSADSTGNNACTLATHDTASPIFGDTKIVIISVTKSAVAKTNSVPVQSFTDPADTAATVEPNPVTTSAAVESYVQIALDSGGTADTSSSKPTFASLADETGTGATHTVNVTLAGNETATLSIYTGEETMSVLVSVHEVIYEGQGSLYAGATLPPGVAEDANLLRAFDATVLSVLFADSAGNLFSRDPRAMIDVGDTLAYTICWTLSETVTRFFRAAGFDTAAGSGSFGVWASDTFAGVWRFVQNAVARRGGETMVVCGVGLTKDVHLGLAHSSSASIPGADGGLCLLERVTARVGLPARWLGLLRAWRDSLLASFVGRLLSALYYLV